MSLFLPDRRPQPLQLWKGVLCKLAKVGANRPAKVHTQIAKVALHEREGGCAEGPNNLGGNATVVVQIGKPASVSSMSVFGRLFRECHQGVSSSKSPCSPAMEGNR